MAIVYPRLGNWKVEATASGMNSRVWLLLVLLGGISLPGLAGAEGESPDVNEAIEELTRNQEEVTAKQQEIDELDEEIARLQAARNSTASEAELIAGQVARLKQRLAKAQLELKHTELTIRVVGQEKKATEHQVQELQDRIVEMRGQLKELIRALYEHEQGSLVRLFFTSDSLGDLLYQRAAYRALHDTRVSLMRELRTREDELKAHQAALAAQQAELGELQELLGAQQQQLGAQRGEQEKFLRAKKQQQAEYDSKLAEARLAREEIEQNVFTLKSAGVTLKLTEARDMAQFASKLTGVRAALLLAVLKVETNLGTSIGSGVFPDDMHPDSREAFLRITKKLGLDPATAPISARPRSYQGWGGAMGPGQFMPATWETIESRIGQLIGKAVPNPYELTDAFVATAMFLADKGATDRGSEYEAVNRYLAGPNWQRFTWYGDRVLAVAAEYEKEGL